MMHPERAHEVLGTPRISRIVEEIDDGFHLLLAIEMGKLAGGAPLYHLGELGASLDPAYQAIEGHFGGSRGEVEHG